MPRSQNKEIVNALKERKKGERLDRIFKAFDFYVKNNKNKRNTCKYVGVTRKTFDIWLLQYWGNYELFTSARARTMEMEGTDDEKRDSVAILGGKVEFLDGRNPTIEKLCETTEKGLALASIMIVREHQKMTADPIGYKPTISLNSLTSFLAVVLDYLVPRAGITQDNKQAKESVFVQHLNQQINNYVATKKRTKNDKLDGSQEDSN